MENVLYETRKLICGLFNFDKAENAVFTPNITTSLNIVLKDYNLILVGTIPTQINIESSDLYIVYEVENLTDFKKILVNNLVIRKEFKAIEKYKEKLRYSMLTKN